MDNLLKFSITSLRARVAETVSIEWQGKKFDPGPLNICIDDIAGTSSGGVLDYAARRAQAEFHVLLTFPRFTEILEQLDANTELAEPVHAVIRSEGDIRNDHSFVLSGPCDLNRHALLNAEETRAFVLPGT